MERQERHREAELDQAALQHVRMLLLALAALVDRAVGLPMVERLRFLAFMGDGEAKARRLIVAMASDPCATAEAAVSPVYAADPYPFTPVHAVGDAALLAARFRMLALALTALLARARDRAPRRHVSPLVLSPGCKPRRSEGWRAVPELPAPDT